MMIEINTKKEKGIIRNYIKKIVITILNQISDEVTKEFITCADCGVVVRKDKAHRVLDYSLVIMPYATYYCHNHKKNYDRMDYPHYYKDNVEVDKKGKIIK